MHAGTRRTCRPSATITTFVLTSLAATFGHQAAAVDLGIDNDAEYQALQHAIRAAEYVRTDFILDNQPTPRVFATLAGVMAFSERNPHADSSQFMAFIDAFDTALQISSGDDPGLTRPESLIASLRFATVDEPMLDGLDTVVGRRALQMLGVSIPDPDGFESIQRRMVRYEIALGKSLEHRPEVFDMLVAGFCGMDLSGHERPALPALLSDYFLTAGYDAALGATRPDMTEVDAGMLALPQNFTEYQASLMPGTANDALRAAVDAELNFLQLHTDALLAELDAELDTAPGLEESIDLANNNPAYVQQVLDELRANLLETTQSRTTATAATFLLLQSQFDEIETYATYTRVYTAASTETDNTLAYIKSGVSIAGNLGIAAATIKKDPATAAGALISATTEVLDLAGVLTSGPSVDEMIYEQLIELRNQVETMRQEMHDRFDRIDQQLNIMYQTMMTGFDSLGQSIDEIATDIDSLVVDMAIVRSQLRQLESALYGVAEDILLTDLTDAANTVLDYRDENGIDLPYAGGSPDFITASEDFFTYATETARSAAFAGSRTSPTVNPANADEYLNGPAARWVNDLAVLPVSIGAPQLTNTTLVGIEPWSQAAAAYAQLARENPWYFAYRYANQVADYESDPMNESLPELDRIMVSGQQIIDFVEAIRDTDANGDSALFDALISNYKSATADLQSAIDQKIVQLTPARFTNGTITLNFWGTHDQDIAALLSNLSILMHRDDGSNWTLPFRSDVPHKGYHTFAAVLSTNVKRVQVWHLLKLERVGSSIGLHGSIDRHGVESARGVFDVWLGSSNWETAHQRRLFTFDAFGNLAGQWIPIPVTTEAIAEQVLTQGWVPSGMQYAYPTSSNTTPTGSQWTAGNGRINVATTYLLDDVTPTTNDIRSDFHYFRSIIATAVLNDLLTPTTPIAMAARKLDHAEALIDAYVSLGTPDLLNRSDVLRSALRSAPGESELGLRSTDAILLINDIDAADSPKNWADTSYSIRVVDDLLNHRIDVIANEIRRGLPNSPVVPGYVQWMMAELNHLRTTAFELAIDDMYVAIPDQPLIVNPAEGLLANDTDQEYRTITVDTAFGPADDGYVAPQHGMLTLSPDGGFTYIPDAGFVGVDTFSYCSTANITGANSATGNPATVVIRVGEIVPEPCPGDTNGDNLINIVDLNVILGNFQQTGAPGIPGDVNGDGVVNITDLNAVLGNFQQSCS